MVNRNSSNPDFVTVAEAAARLRVCPRSIHRWIASKDLRVHRLGRRIRIAEADLQAFLTARKQ